jgi:3-hydroxyacyl-CoA dehydrogenase
MPDNFDNERWDDAAGAEDRRWEQFRDVPSGRRRYRRSEWHRTPASRLLIAIVLIGAGRTFIAGADIREFGKIVSGEKPRLALLPYLQSIEDSVKPVVVAIHGTALGGGLETAMSGHYRVIAPDAQVGQPEVKLGLIPWAGGTQRLPRLAGPAKAAELCAFGD